jgi:5-methylcytosine-specific restriction endonuclease McrA
MVDRRRLFRAQYQDISILDRITSTTYRISGSKGDVYEVNVRRPSCTCPDWIKRKPRGGCKHVLVVKLERGEITELSYPGKNRGKKSSLSRYPEHWQQRREKCLDSDEFACQKCGAQGGPNGSAQLHVHHIKPKSKGGSDKLSNLITVCHSCHEEVHNHAIPEFERAYAKSSYNSSSSTRTDAGSTVSSDTPAKRNLRSSSSSRDPKQSRSPEKQSTDSSGGNDPNDIPLFDDQINFIPPWSQSHPRNQEQQSPSQSSNTPINTTPSEDHPITTEADSTSASPDRTHDTQEETVDETKQDNPEREIEEPGASNREDEKDPTEKSSTLAEKVRDFLFD